MIPNELIKLIEKYCMGKQPTDTQQDEIFDKVAELVADPIEVVNLMQELQKGPTREEREAKEREAKAKAEREARAKEEREAKAKAEREAKEREAKAKAEREAKERAEREAILKAEEMATKRKKKIVWTTVFALLILTAVICCYIFRYLLWFILSGVAVLGAIAFFFLAKRKFLRWTVMIICLLLAVNWYNKGKESLNYDNSTIETSEKSESQNTQNESDNMEDDAAIIDESGLSILDKLKLRYDYVYSEDSDGNYKVKKNNKVGLCDGNGKLLIEVKYDYIYSKDAKDLIKVQADSKYGLIDSKTYKEVVPCEYDYFYSESNGLIKVQKNGKYGFLNANTYKLVTPCIYDYIYSPDGGLIKVQQEGKTGYLKLDGSLAKKPE